jgi:hypothetical protein
MTSFSATVYQVQNAQSVLTFWASADGLHYTPVTTSVTAAPALGAGALQYSPAAGLPAGTAFLLALISTPGVNPDLSPLDPTGITTSGVPPQDYVPVPDLEIGGITISRAAVPLCAAPAARRHSQ